jgi:hypothetical protein
VGHNNHQSSFTYASPQEKDILKNMSKKKMEKKFINGFNVRNSNKLQKLGWEGKTS